jgi:hypothetical protein
MPVMLAELGKVQPNITEPELGRARLMSQESTGSRCEQLARQIQAFDRVIPTGGSAAQDQCRDRGGYSARGGSALPWCANAGDGSDVGAGADVGEYRGDAVGLMRAAAFLAC